MAKKNYRVMYGDHMIPNPAFRLGEDDPGKAHVSAPAGSVITLDEERAAAFTKRLPGGAPPKLVETTDKPVIAVQGGAVEAPPPEPATPKMAPIPAKVEPAKG